MSAANGAPLLEVREVGKYFGNVIALKDISTVVKAQMPRRCRMRRTWPRFSNANASVATARATSAPGR